MFLPMFAISTFKVSLIHVFAKQENKISREHQQSTSSLFAKLSMLKQNLPHSDFKNLKVFVCSHLCSAFSWQFALLVLLLERKESVFKIPNSWQSHPDTTILSVCMSTLCLDLEVYLKVLVFICPSNVHFSIGQGVPWGHICS